MNFPGPSGISATRCAPDTAAGRTATTAGSSSVTRCLCSRPGKRISSTSVSLRMRGDTEVEEMRFPGREHKHRVTDELPAVVAVRPAAVSGAQRVAEIPEGPGKFIEALLDLDHRAKIGLAHRLEAGGRSQYRAHQRSLVLSATLSRRYTGTAVAASFASPAAKRGTASFSTARAVGAASGRIAETLSPSRAARSSR